MMSNGGEGLSVSRGRFMEPSPPCGQFDSELTHESPPAQQSGAYSSTNRLSPGRSSPWLYENRRSAQQIIPGLWLGPFSCSSGELGSTAGAWTYIIIRAAQEHNHVKLLPMHPHSTVFFEFSSHHGLELLMPIFLPACVAIHAALSAGNAVGLFCISGLSRAPSIAAAYLIAQCGMSAADAVQSVSSQRSCVHFSDSILRQLHEFELLQKSRVSVASCGADAAESSSRKRNDSASPHHEPSQDRSFDS
jgi:serine/threonine/tyrosine-interacting protein